MTEPVLTPQQEKKSLSAKKAAKKKKPLKHVLIKPGNIEYRPNATLEESETILGIIKMFPRLIPEKTPILWSAIKNIPKEQRKSFRAQHQTLLQDNTPTFRKHIILGINKVTEHLECNKLKAVLLTADIDPFYMIRHVLELCVNKHVNVLIVEQLRQSLQEHLGVASTCIGIANGHKNQLLKELCEEINIICQGYPQPSIDSDKMIVGLSDNNDSLSYNPNEANSQKSVSDATPPKNVYLIKTSKERVFQPEKVQRSRAFNTNFIKFSAPDPKVSKEFIGMQVKKLAANRVRDAQGYRKTSTHAKGWFNPNGNKFKPNKKQIKNKFH